jgi:hypothetical protein
MNVFSPSYNTSYLCQAPSPFILLFLDIFYLFFILNSPFIFPLPLSLAFCSFRTFYFQWHPSISPTPGGIVFQYTHPCVRYHDKRTGRFHIFVWQSLQTESPGSICRPSPPPRKLLAANLREKISVVLPSVVHCSFTDMSSAHLLVTGSYTFWYKSPNRGWQGILSGKGL